MSKAFEDEQTDILSDAKEKLRISLTRLEDIVENRVAKVIKSSANGNAKELGEQFNLSKKENNNLREENNNLQVTIAEEKVKNKDLIELKESIIARVDRLINEMNQMIKERDNNACS